EHADHQLGINRWPSQRAVERRELAAQFRQVDKAVDRPQQMISRHMSIEREVVEQHTLFDLPWSHHRLSSCLSTGLNQWTFTVSTSAFFNKIGHERRFCPALPSSALPPIATKQSTSSEVAEGPRSN